MTKLKIRLISAGIVVTFLAITGLLGLLLAGRPNLWMLEAVLALVGVSIGALVYWYLSTKYRDALAAAEGGSGGGAKGSDTDIDVTVAAAQARLRNTPATKGKTVGKLPVVLILGPKGSAKTTSIVNSGLEPELLAGEADRGGAVVPTGNVNVWYSQDKIVVEAGGDLLDAPSGWARVIKHIQPSRLAAAFKRGEQAPRVAVVCYPCDEFLKPGNSESVPGAARKLRDRLAEVSQQLGIRLPVYVLFTKADRLPYFEDFVRSMSREEAQEILGATLPATESGDVGTFAERESTRVRGALNGIIHSLALKRLDVLPREAREELRAGAYEFPREMRKIAELTTAFLVELCKPRQLGVSPFLRGFYFTGVRPVILTDVAAERGASRQSSQSSSQIALGATSVFNPAAMRAAAEGTQAPVAPAVGGKKVPEWTFLRRVLRDIVFQDRDAMQVTTGGTRVNLLRRTLLISAAALFLLLFAGFATSYLNNRGLEGRALTAARAVEGIPPYTAELAPYDELQRMDSLRSQAQLLRRYDVDGPPLRLRWGLYTGSRVMPELRRLYFDRFERTLWGMTRTNLLASLRGLPDTPNESSQYGAIYDMLKAHLITTNFPHESTPDFLGPVLLTQWKQTTELEPERNDLALQHFSYFGEELPFGNPYDDPADDATIERTRVLLHSFGGVDQFYQVMISEASRDNPAIQFDQEFPNATGVVRNSYIVPGAFTKGGYAAVQQSLGNIDQLFSREDWVVGAGSAPSAQDRVRLSQDLRARYTADFISHWRNYLTAGAVAQVGSLADAQRILGRLSGNDSPVLQMLALASRNTDVDSAAIAQAFQPVHQVVPPGVTDRFVSEPNAPYIAALGNLQSSFTQVAAAPPAARNAPSMQVVSDADKVRAEIRNIAQNFSIQGDAGAVGSTVQALLQAPTVGIESLVGGLASGAVNQAGAGFCGPFRTLSNKFPFSPQASTDATMDEIAAAFTPGASSLSTLQQETLQDLVVRQGRTFVPRAGVTPQPTAAFLSFFNRAVQVSEALYDENGAGPQIQFLLRPQTSPDLPEITVNIDGQAQTFTQTISAARTFTWQGDRAREATITANVNGRQTTLLEQRGPWALFRLFHTADWETLGNDRYMLRWTPVGTQQVVAAELTLPTGTPPIFRADFFGQLSCVPTIVR